MASSSSAAQALRIRAEDFKNRVESGESSTILDARNPKAWTSSNVKIRGALRIEPDQVSPNPDWPRDQLTVVY